MSTLALDRPVLKTVTLDVLLCVAVIAIPAMSHAAAFPLYKFEPMRLLLFAAILFSSRRNALLMAVWMPLLAMLTSGHPVFPKVVLIQGELVVNTLLFFGLVRGGNRFVLAAAGSILVSKTAYYAAKFILIRMSLLSGDLIATSWLYQLATLAFILFLGSLAWTWRDRDADVFRSAEPQTPGRS
jgi:hypothetical protein